MKFLELHLYTFHADRHTTKVRLYTLIQVHSCVGAEATRRNRSSTSSGRPRSHLPRSLVHHSRRHFHQRGGLFYFGRRFLRLPHRTALLSTGFTDCVAPADFLVAPLAHCSHVSVIPWQKNVGGQINPLPPNSPIGWKFRPRRTKKSNV